MDFVKSHLEKMKLWPVEHCADLEKKKLETLKVCQLYPMNDLLAEATIF